MAPSDLPGLHARIGCDLVLQWSGLSVAPVFDRLLGHGPGRPLLRGLPNPWRGMDRKRDTEDPGGAVHEGDARRLGLKAAPAGSRSEDGPRADCKPLLNREPTSGLD